MEKIKDIIRQYHPVIIFVILIVIIVLGFQKSCGIVQELSELQKDVSTTNLHIESETPGEYTQTIDFLENEIAKYREFYEKQQTNLIKLVGFLGSSLVALFAFFGIKDRRDISKVIQEQYASQVEKELSNLIGGGEKIKYLRNGVKREERIKQTQILFLYQDKMKKNFKEVYTILEDQDEKYQVEKKKMKNMVSDKDIENLIEGNNIIIYQVGDSEYKNGTNDSEKNKDLIYVKIAEKCNNKQMYCILYCEGNIDRKLCKENFYVSNANFGLTLMERICSLLYFI